MVSPPSTPSQLPFAVTPLLTFFPISSVVSAIFFRVVWVWHASASRLGSSAPVLSQGRGRKMVVVRRRVRVRVLIWEGLKWN